MQHSLAYLPGFLCILALCVMATTLSAEEPSSEGDALTREVATGAWSDYPEAGSGQPSGSMYFLFEEGRYYRMDVGRCPGDVSGKPVPLKDYVVGGVGRWTMTEEGVRLEPRVDAVVVKGACVCKPKVARSPCHTEIEALGTTPREGVITWRYEGRVEGRYGAPPAPQMQGDADKPFRRSAYQEVESAEAFFNRSGAGANLPAAYLDVLGCEVDPEMPPPEGSWGKKGAMIRCEPSTP